MFCGNCGKPTNQDDIFCGHCGTRQELQTAVSETATTIATSSVQVPHQTIASNPSIRKPMTKQQKVFLSAGTGVVGVLLIGYFVARALSGPSSPAALQTALDNALAKKSASSIKALIDPTETSLRNTAQLKVFTQSINTDVVTYYGNQVGQLVSEQSDPLSQALASYANNDNSFRLVKKSTWLGTKWYIHIPTTTVTVQGVPGDTMTYSLNGSNLDSTLSQSLLPSDYTLTVSAKNKYGSESETADVNLLNGSGQTIDASQLMKTGVTIQFPDPSLMQVTATLNGDTLTADDNNQVVLVPAPKSGTLQVQATVAGQQITGQQSISSSDQQIDLSQAVNQALGQQLAKALLTYNQSWAKAWTDKNPNELTGVDPSTDAYTGIVNQIQNHTSPQSQTLTKLVLDPSTIQVNSDNTVTVEDSEFFQDETGNQSEADWQYSMSGGTNGWIVESMNSSWNSISDSNPNVIVESP